MYRSRKPSLKSQSGYLLLETLITASIMLTLFPIVSYKSASILETQETSQFIKSLEELLYEAQLTALTENRSVYVQLNETTHEAYSYFSLTSQLETLKASHSIHFQKGTLSLVLRFTPQGTVSQAGTFLITSKQATYQFTFLLGQGRFYVKKQ